MIKFIAPLLLICSCAFANPDFVQCTQFFYNANYPQQGWAQWRSSYHDLPGAPGWTGGQAWVLNQWTIVDVSRYVPADAKVVFLDYILLLTPSPATNSNLNMTFSVRRPGAGSYINKIAGSGAWLSSQNLPVNPDLADGLNRYPAQAATASAVNPSLVPSWPNTRSPGHLSVPVTNGQFEIYYSLRNPAPDGSNGWYGVNITVGGYCK